jgi:hypothetical protein
MEDREWMYTGRRGRNDVTTEWIRKTDDFVERTYGEAIGMNVDIEMVVDEEEDEVQNDNDLVILEGNDINDELAPSDGVDYEMVDSDDESYDPANPDAYKDYF